MYIWIHTFSKYAIYYTHNFVSPEYIEYIPKPKHKKMSSNSILILVNVIGMKGKPSETVEDVSGWMELLSQSDAWSTTPVVDTFASNAASSALGST
jgi:hypothetical protein